MKMKNFIRKKEDFVCENCGKKVVGDGYTDHCPECLWGKHVDKKIPGDRKSGCGGMMKPVSSVYEKGSFKISYKCEKCKHTFQVKEGRRDNRESMVKLSCGINSENMR